MALLFLERLTERLKQTEIPNRYLMPRTSHNAGEDGSWSIISGKSGFAHTGAIVNYEGGNIIVTHFDGLVGLVSEKQKPVIL